jgi:alpha-mannosidase/mannosylglycerate hydrolase
MHVVSHTHWDREWYQPHEVFRLRLVDLMDHLLDILDTDEQFRHFSLDAQTIVLEDYLQIRPGARSRIEKHVRSGRLAVGPWYQLNDEFLVSGEATIRSLLIGSRIAEAFGRCMMVGYLPDQFGSISQMPQILRGFGMDNAIMGRGRQLLRPGDKMEFWWQSPDGSRVLASLMAYWYNNAQYIPADPEAALAFVKALRDTMAARSAASELLFMNGVDHLEAQPTIGRTIAGVADLLAGDGSGDRILHSSLTAYVDALRATVGQTDSALDTVIGELRQDRGGACLAGTLSSRVYLKQANFAAQNALEAYAERLCSFARIMGAPYPAEELRYAWKLLMQNHPHDSICGCSVDQVHDEMMPRFHRVRQVAEIVQDRALDTLTGRDRTQGAVALPCDLHVFNTLNWERTDPVRVTLEFPLGAPTRSGAARDPSAMVRGLRIIAPDGEEVPFAVTGDETLVTAVLSPHELPLDQWVQRLTVEFVAKDVPACGSAVYRLEPGPSWEHAPTFADVASYDYSEPTLQDVGDVGDEYLYRRPLNDVCVELCLACLDAWATQETAVKRTEIVQTVMHVPASSASAGRSSERVAIPVQLERTQWAGVPRTECRLRLTNTATDHRLRALFDAAGPVSAAVPFDVVTRRSRPEDEAAGASPYHPMTLWIDAPGGDDLPGRTIICPGLYEYEVLTDSDGRTSRVAVTLLRCVGQLSGRGDGPGIATPGAQCPGEHVFDLAVVEHPGDWVESRAWKGAHQFATPLVAVQAPRNDYVPTTRSFMTVEPDRLVLSAAKCAEDRDTLIVRLFNITDKAVPNGFVAVNGAAAWRRTNLNEHPDGDWTDGAEARLTVGPKQIVTLEFRL